MQRWKKCVENEKDCEKRNSVKDVPMVYIIFNITIIIVSEKKIGDIAFVLTFVSNKI
jgi:hypothetical protein